MDFFRNISIKPKGFRSQKEIIRISFEDCCKKLVCVLQPEICNKLADYYEFSRQQKRRFRTSTNFVEDFVDILKKERIIKPNDSDLLEHGLRYIDQHELVSQVAEIFKAPLETEIYNKEDLCWLLVNFLKRNYSSQYQDITPLGCLEKTVSVNELYIDGRIEILVKKDSLSGTETWIRLESYHEIVSVALERGAVLLEGDPGCGKSMLMLQLVHEWCENIQKSPMTQVDLLIFLQLEKVEVDRDIYDSISRLLLPDESSINIDNISNVIHSYSSVMIFLDGVDNVAEAQWISGFLLDKVHAKKFSLVITTRPVLLTGKYFAEMKRFRLCGYDATEKEKYVRKVFNLNNKDGTVQICNKTSAVASLNIFSENSLLFFTFVNMSSQKGYPEDASTITNIFRQVMPLIMSHGKTETEVNGEDFLENEYLLSHEEYDTLVKSGEKKVWSKQDLANITGKNVTIFIRELASYKKNESVSSNLIRSLLIMTI